MVTHSLLIININNITLILLYYHTEVVEYIEENQRKSKKRCLARTKLTTYCARCKTIILKSAIDVNLFSYYSLVYAYMYALDVRVCLSLFCHTTDIKQLKLKIVEIYYTQMNSGLCVFQFFYAFYIKQHTFQRVFFFFRCLIILFIFIFYVVCTCTRIFKIPVTYFL